MIKKIVFLGLFLCIASYGFCQEDTKEENIARIEVKGNSRISTTTVISKLKTRASQAFNENVINEDVKNLIATGFFEDVGVDKEDSAEGIIIIFKLKEKPVAKKIIFEGNRIFHRKKIAEMISIKEGSFIDEYKLKEAASQIKDGYTKKGFANATVTYEIKSLPEKNETEVKFVIVEKKVLKVRKIKVSGNKLIPSRKIVKVMKIRNSWLFNSGIFKKDIIDDDIKRIVDFYKLAGFSDVAVSIEPKEERKGVIILVNIVEGKRYYIGDIKVEGNKEATESEIRKAMILKSGSIFSDQKVYEDSTKIKEVYMDKGYIFSQVEPSNILNVVTQKVDLVYKIVENNQAYIERIIIKGNNRTKDKVIRRELRVYPQEKFDNKKIKKSKERLDNLGFFEEVRFDTAPGTKPDWVDLIAEVKEQKTGSFSFGGGYSTVDQLMGFAEIRQTNFDYKNFSTFTGAGQDLSLSMSLGSLSNNYQLSFTNPWIFDRPVSFGFDLYRSGHKRDEDSGYAYQEDLTGGAIRFGRQFNDELSGRIAYRVDSVEISDVIDLVSQAVIDEIGTNVYNTVELGLAYDTRDSVTFPLSGMLYNNAFQVTGGPFGGDEDFIKYYTHYSYFQPVINKSVVEFKLRGGFAQPFGSSNRVPIYERFFTGGASTIRGYEERKVGPLDSATNDPVGGESMFIGNIEYTYPLADFIKAATFYDTGNTWEKENDFFGTALKSSYGFGIRVKTPIGPISIDYGWPLDTVQGEDGKQGKFHFNMSRGF